MIDDMIARCLEAARAVEGGRENAVGAWIADLSARRLPRFEAHAEASADHHSGGGRDPLHNAREAGETAQADPVPHTVGKASTDHQSGGGRDPLHSARQAGETPQADNAKAPPVTPTPPVSE